MLYKKLLIILANSTSENSFHLYRAVFHSCFFRILIENRGFPCVLISRLIVMLLLALRLWLHLVTCLLGNKECGTEIHVPSSLSSQMWQEEFAGAETGRKDCQSFLSPCISSNTWSHLNQDKIAVMNHDRIGDLFWNMFWRHISSLTYIKRVKEENKKKINVKYKQPKRSGLGELVLFQSAADILDKFFLYKGY